MDTEDKGDRQLVIGAYRVVGDPDALDTDLAFRVLSQESYWARERALATNEVAFANSRIAVALDPDDATAGFARAVTDGATFAWLGDVWVEPDHRGQGLGVGLVRWFLEGPLGDIRRWALVTSSASTLYERFGFVPVGQVGDGPLWMERVRQVQ